jgi:hypothetical protein
MGKEPEEERKNGAEDQTGDDGEIERGVFAAVDDVTGEFAESEGELGPEVEQGADDDEDEAEQEKSAAEIAERIHKSIIEEGAQLQPNQELKMSGHCRLVITASGCAEFSLRYIY